MVSITAVRACGFQVYRDAKYKIDGWIENYAGTSPVQHANTPGTMPNVWTVSCFTAAGMVSGGTMAFVMSMCRFPDLWAFTNIM